jgi:hypothetical protein
MRCDVYRFGVLTKAGCRIVALHDISDCVPVPSIVGNDEFDISIVLGANNIQNPGQMLQPLVDWNTDGHKFHFVTDV